MTMIMALVGCSHPPDVGAVAPEATAPTPSGQGSATKTSEASNSPVAETPPSPTATEAAAAQITGVSFVTATRGWVLYLAAGCSPGCSPRLLTTRDAGTHFAKTASPPGDPAAITFADDRTGFAYAGTDGTSVGMQVTRDGAKTWQPVPALDRVRVVTVAVTGCWAYATVDTGTSQAIWGSPVAEDDWHPIQALGPDSALSSVSLTAGGGTAWASSASFEHEVPSSLYRFRDGQVTRLPVPTACGQTDVVLGAASTTILWIFCTGNDTETVLRSTSAGSAFTTLADNAYSHGVTALAAIPGDDRTLLVLTYEDGLFRDTYGPAATSSALLPYSVMTDRLAAQFTDPTHAFSYQGAELLVSTDGGETLHARTLPNL